MTNDTKVTKLYKKDDSNTDESQQTPNVEQPVQQESTDQEKMESYAKLGKEHGYTGIPNDDAMSDIPIGQIELPSDEVVREETKLQYHDVIEAEETTDARMRLNK
ncbi:MULTISPECIES: hypothetical protein [Staphylococcus]|uniref:Uncharacterized protein n=2 Tax=Staphylococcus arlettae TaxID=29378 RepID=A0A2T7BRL2_9STAP|nr:MULTISPECIES: hypothetical protein [Staphylococcus]KAB2477666.1 hypothetical protein F9B39_10915 [Staphylococcus sp. CH99b_3]MBK3719268.1 hypothetical protein [Staphylococcus arlettae]MCD8850342.1 hypothetical protein [Staphylococcus arlettae]PTH29831.1 hypothetical protein BU605_02120 [Staphylococcus arlettae]PTH41879.1 hypothetical protein BU596_11380 [Staphylococcus arlettae]